MFFSGKKIKKTKNKCSLSKKHQSVSSRQYCSSFQERTSLFAPYERQASLTIEAAMTIPLFIMACLSILFLVEAFRIQNTLQSAMCRTGENIGQTMCLFQTEADDSLIAQYPILAKGISVLAIQQIVKEDADKSNPNYSCIQGGREGISFLYSNVKDEWVDIIASYKLKLPFPLIPLPDIPVVQRFRIRAWTGEEGLADKAVTERMVYITKTGSVYHITKECTHLKLSIQPVMYAQLSNLRNVSGAKYYACEKCVRDSKGKETVYITDDGTCYHNSLNCSGLKRQIEEIPFAEVEERACCSRCGVQ